ncbi:MAG TPA: TonB-dependent receptor [Opitutaceae bacterium]|nr:TonB-dependent receptor [Opitutaceae bacterium]
MSFPHAVSRFLLLLLGVAVSFPPRARAQAAGATGSAALKQLSLDDLLKTEVTSVSKFRQPLMDAATSIDVITNETIRRSAALTLPEALRLADNLNVAQKNPHDWAVSARGFNSNLGDKMLVLIDGRAVYTPLFAGVFWNAQDYILEDVARIEAISGPGGTLWGANAVNGVVNITTKPAEETQGLYLDAGTGTTLRETAALRYGGTAAPNVFFRVYGKYFSEGPARLASGSSAADVWHQAQGGFRLDAMPAPGKKFTLQADSYGGDLGIQGSGVARIAGGNLLGRWTQTAADGAETRLQFYVDRTHLSDPFAATGFAAAGFLKDDLDTYDLDFQSGALAGRHHVVWGLGYRHVVDRVRQQAPNFGFVPAHDDEDLASGFAQDEIALSDRVALIAGTKIEHNSFTGFEIEPNLRLRWNPSPRWMMWTAVSRAVRTPTRLDRNLAEPVANPLIKGGPTFGSEGLVAYELGWRAEMGPQVDVSLSAFYHDYDHLRGLSLTPRTLLPLVYSNSLEGETHGAELSVDYRPLARWQLAAGFSLLREHVRVRPGRTDFFNALDETEDPRQQFSLRSSLDLPKGIQFDTHFRWIGALIVNSGGRPATVPAYAELDARLTYPISLFADVSLAGQNLLDAQHPEYGAPSPAREELRRSVYAKLTFRY